MSTSTVSTPADRSWPTGLVILTIATIILLLVAAYMAFLYAPTELTMGAVQRVFYYHVGSAWAGAVAFLVTVVVGVLYLVTQDRRWDTIGHSSVEVGLALTTVALAGGMTWGQFAWGTPWTWDPKLTSFAVMWLSYAAYLMLRQSIDDPSRRARFGAVYGIVAFASVIMTFLGVRLIEATIHPAVIGQSASTARGDFGLAPRMLQTMLFSFLTFTFVYATLVWHRVRLANFADQVNLFRSRLYSE